MARLWRPAARGDPWDAANVASWTGGESRIINHGQQLVTLHFNGVNGREPDLQQIASVLGGRSQLVYSSCEAIQGRIVGQLRIRVDTPLTAESLRLAAQVADSVAVG